MEIICDMKEQWRILETKSLSGDRDTEQGAEERGLGWVKQN